tara:strand:- start:9776 stop:10189 length:414 start_codon:yes stop_codon:yes gene_type:complete
MTILNNLLEMLEKVKQENPELANRVQMASEVLNIEDEDVELLEEEEEYDDTYIPISEEESKKMVSFNNKLNSAISDFGTYMRDHEVLKISKLQGIEGLRDSQEKLIQSLRDKYRLNPNFNYRLTQEGTTLVFVKKES